MKRAFDIACALAGLAVSFPLLALIAVAVWIEDRHSPWFWGTRLARGGGEFRMLKFRTMIPDAWKTGVNSTAAGDRRITSVGRWLRATKLDELPQLWNVLRGEMSLVGPRPQVAADAALYTAVERRMLTVRPGVTDLASIVFADEGAILAGSADPDLLYNQIIRPWKSRLALLAIDRGTLASDLSTILLTMLAAVSRTAALAGVARILAGWDADPQLQRVALRADPLVGCAPPGASQIVAAYPKLSPNASRVDGLNPNGFDMHGRDEPYAADELPSASRPVAQHPSAALRQPPATRKPNNTNVFNPTPITEPPAKRPGARQTGARGPGASRTPLPSATQAQAPAGTEVGMSAGTDFPDQQEPV